MSGLYKYCLIDEEGELSVTDEEGDWSWDTYPTVIRFCIVDYGDLVRYDKLTSAGWVEIKEID